MEKIVGSNFVEVSSDQHLLDRIEHMRLLLVEKDNRIKELEAFKDNVSEKFVPKELFVFVSNKYDYSISEITRLVTLLGRNGISVNGEKLNF